MLSFLPVAREKHITGDCSLVHMVLALLVCIFARMNDTPESPHMHTQGVNAISLKKSYTWLEKKCTKSTALR